MELLAQVVGQSSAFLDALDLASRAAPLDRPVLVVGERGTGKELLAERLHRLSPRWDAPLVTLNCAALPETLIEAELFGYEQGAFTGATRARDGRFEEADGGTLFLDELATLSSAAQERLLRAIEYGEVARIGARRPVEVNVRVVAATNEHLPALVDAGRFRADLLDRLAFEVITLPPLRARGEDIPLLAEHFGRRMAFELGRADWHGFAPEVEQALQRHDWPGNVRQLKNVVERAVYRWDDPARPVGAVDFDPFASPWLLTPSPSPPTTAQAPAPPAVETEPGDFRAACSAHERRLLEAALDRHRYNQRAAAAGLSLSYDQLRHALRRHGLLPGAAGRAPA
jgi:psp operon transcriptional activator